jgi:DNA-binding FadR family transcriptional regulator
MNLSNTPRRKYRSLAVELVDRLTTEIREGRLAEGDKLPTEASIMEAFGVSRTVVREAISRLQAAGLVQTRHGVGTFVLAQSEVPAFRVSPEQLATLREVIALLELRIGIESEAAALAAMRRTEENLIQLRKALDAFAGAVESGRDAVAADADFHQEIARATQNHHFIELMKSLGAGVIPRSRLEDVDLLEPERQAYLRRVNQEHESIYDAIAAQDVEAARAAMRTHLSNSRERHRRGASVHRQSKPRT